MWYFTSPPPMVLRGSTSSNLVKISEGKRPMVLVITFKRPRWLIASMAVVTPQPALTAKMLIEKGNERCESFERESLGAEVARLNDLLEEIGVDELRENRAPDRASAQSAPCAPAATGAARDLRCA